MIARLSGTPSYLANTLIIDVHGVGYEVFATADTTAWATDHTNVTISIYTHVTETSLELFGFKDESEKKLFMMLISVSGVGPKTALGILNLGTTQTVTSLQQADISFFAKAPRVGKKLAQKIIIELGNKVGAASELDLTPLDAKQRDIVEALVSLGYDEFTAQQALKTLQLDELSVQDAIKAVMKKK